MANDPYFPVVLDDVSRETHRLGMSFSVSPEYHIRITRGKQILGTVIYRNGLLGADSYLVIMSLPAIGDSQEYKVEFTDSCTMQGILNSIREAVDSAVQGMASQVHD